MARADSRLEGSGQCATGGRDVRIGGSPEAGESCLWRAGLQNVVLAQDRLRVDCVDLLLHDLSSSAVGGLVIHTSSVNARGIVQFRIRHDTFFVDPRLLVVVIPCRNDGDLDETAFVIPAADLPAVTSASLDRGDPGYQGSFRLSPLAEKMRPYAVPSKKLGAGVLERLFPGRLSDRAKPGA